MWRKGKLCALLVKMEIAATVETMWKSLETLKIELPYDTAILLVRIYLKKIKPMFKKVCTPPFHGSVIIIAKTWKQPRCSSVDEWIKKVCCTG